ncbi:TraB/GumN family protein [Oceanobacillus damuensis]|uniref:TraB/GumN family protein n=1 Tax=Oceanobacillus damuensis TaxID=937928 RepID=UPI00082C44E2|nr:TraB/GumN family protein [Oceanobacillus damuensis]
MWQLRSLLMVLLVFVMAACQVEEALTFSDEQLESALREEIGKAEGVLYPSDFEGIDELDLSDSGIEVLNDMEHFDDLKTLSLQDNQISDFTALKGLTSMEEVDVSGNPIDGDERQKAILEELREQGIAVHYTEKAEVVGRPDGPGGFLWKVENGDTTVYLQGTVHAGTEDFYPLHEKIEQAYNESDVIVPEIDITTINPIEMQNILMEIGVYQDGSTIKNHISDELYSELDRTMEELEVPLQLFETYKPWILSSTVQQLMTEQLGYIYGVDEYFLVRAAEDGKEIIALETAEDQLNIFADTSEDYQIQMLDESLMDIEEYDKELQELFTLYKEGDTDNLLNTLKLDGEEATEEDQAFMEALNDKRNEGMAASITEFLKEDNGQTYFVIVGSLHLILEPHIISILEEQGYQAQHIH